MMLPFCILLLLLLPASCGNVANGGEERIEVESQSSNMDDEDDEVPKMIEWLKANGGFLDPRVEIRRVNPNNDPTSYYGVFTNAPIREDEVLIKIPDSLKIKSFDDGGDWYYSEMICELSWTLAREFEKGDESKHLPYINYLKTQEKGQIPGAWSSAGKQLLLQVQGNLRISDRDEEDDPDPEYLVNWLEEYANEECAVGLQALDPHLIALAVQRGYDSVLVPIYDMINHSNNPQKINIITYSSTDDDDEFVVHAIRDIAAGEELFYSYDNCPECEDAVEYWGTPELLRDFGFVEEYPHVYYVAPDIPIFVEEVNTEDGQLTHVATCIDENCPEKSWVEQMVQNLVDAEKRISEAASTVPHRELAIIKEYHNALLVAFSAIWSQNLYR